MRAAWKGAVAIACEFFFTFRGSNLHISRNPFPKKDCEKIFLIKCFHILFFGLTQVILQILYPLTRLDEKKFTSIMFESNNLKFLYNYGRWVRVNGRMSTAWSSAIAIACEFVFTYKGSNLHISGNPFPKQDCETIFLIKCLQILFLTGVIFADTEPLIRLGKKDSLRSYSNLTI